MKKDEKKILSVQEILHLQSDKHEKKDQIMPDVDTSRYVLTQKPKQEAVRRFTPVINITEEQRKQFNQGDAAPSRNALLAEQSRHAMQVIKLHAEEEAVELEKAAEGKTAKTDKAADKLTNEIRAGNFEFCFGALTEGSGNLKDTI
ncbi:MAG: hypothetical protein FWC19_09830 [Treponema sp.]|nr:hypothetical protein [Treponema sp.]MCL2273085.1 hypothetical protein [Treponema sp.]